MNAYLIKTRGGVELSKDNLCPRCRKPLEERERELVCLSCGHRIRKDIGVRHG